MTWFAGPSACGSTTSRLGSTNGVTTRSGPTSRRRCLEHGVRTYSIFLDDQTNELFAYVEFESEERWAQIAQTEVCQRWWRSMRQIMPSNPDNSPVSRDCREVFHIEHGVTS